MATPNPTPTNGTVDAHQGVGGDPRPLITPNAAARPKLSPTTIAGVTALAILD